MPTQWLVKLSGLISRNLPPEEAVREALPLVREALNADDVFFVYGDGDGAGFAQYGTSTTLGLDNAAVWTIYRDLTSRSGPCAFDVVEGHVCNFRDASRRQPCGHVAALIPMEGLGEMVIARGSWPRGLGSRLDSVETALPALALVLERRLDAHRAQRQRNQLSALANIPRVLSESGDLETVLTSMASTIATATGIDYVTIDLVDNAGNVTLRCFKLSRPGMEAFTERWRRGASRPDAARDTVLRTREPLLVADAPNDPRLPEAVRTFAARALTRSIGTLPLLTRDGAIGVIIFASHRQLDFTPEHVELLQALAAQTANAVQAIRLYQELAASKGQLQRLNEQLLESMSIQHHLARTDQLTGIPNRRYLEEALEAECARVARYGQPLSVVMVDLDHLKQVNDKRSHQSGDDVMRHVAYLARESCRQADAVARYGGDEFVFILPATALPEATLFAERFRERLAANPTSDSAGHPVQLTVSLGVAQWEAATTRAPSHLLEQADRAMYAAKAAGRNRTMVSENGEARAA